jgi:hypothetical protein
MFSVAVGEGVRVLRAPGGGKGLTMLPGLTAIAMIRRRTMAATARTTMESLSHVLNFIPSPSVAFSSKN